MRTLAARRRAGFTDLTLLERKALAQVLIGLGRPTRDIRSITGASTYLIERLREGRPTSKAAGRGQQLRLVI